MKTILNFIVQSLNMKKILFLPIILMFCVIVFSAFITRGSLKEEDTIIREITKNYKTDFSKFQNEVNTLKLMAETAESQSDFEKLRTNTLVKFVLSWA